MAGHQHLVVMGVAGCGKTTVATILADRLGWPSAEADDVHPARSIAKLRAGIALTDEDRAPWLRAIRDWMTAQDADGRSSVVTCSALRRTYRDVLREAPGRVRFVHLDGSPDVIEARLDARAGHVMPATLLPSQLRTLEPLAEDEDGVVVPIVGPPDAVVDHALRALGLL